MSFTTQVRLVNDSQINYTTIEKELLAVVFALEKFIPYLVGSHIFIPIIPHLGTFSLKRMLRLVSFVGSFYFKNLTLPLRIKKDMTMLLQSTCLVFQMPRLLLFRSTRISLMNSCFLYPLILGSLTLSTT